MMNVDTIAVLIALVLVCTVFSACHGAPTAECLKLEQMARQASQRQIAGFDMYCKANTACTGIDCNGNINMATYNIQTEFCFGFEIQNCIKPTQVDFYSYLPALNKSFEERLANSDRRQIQGASVDIGLGRIDPFANITLKDEADNKILFGVGLALRLTYLFDRQGHWPRSLQYTLIPPTEIPVAPCKTPSTTMAPPVDNKCITRVAPTKTTASPGMKTTSLKPRPTSTPTRKPRPPSTPMPKPISTHKPISTPQPPKPTVRPSESTKTTSRPTVVTTPKHPGPRPKPSPTFGKECNPYDFRACGINEKCVSHVSSAYPACQCASQTTYDKWFGRCVGESPVPQPTKHSLLPTKVIPTTDNPATNDTRALPTAHALAANSSNHKTIVIATCTTAAVLLLAGLALTTYLIIRKKRARYADHDILLQNDNSEVNI